MKRINYDHKNFNEIQSAVTRQFDGDFNQIQLDVVEKYCDNMLFEYIQTPNFKIMCDEWLDDTNDIHIEKRTSAVYEWLEREHYDAINDHFYEREHYPMWNTLFEAKNKHLGERLEEMVDELYEIGIGVIESRNSLNTMLFINGAGYDFYEAHWIPLYQLLGWINEKLLED